MQEKHEHTFMFGTDIARILKMHPKTFFRLVEADKSFPVYRIGKSSKSSKGQRRFLLKEVLEYMSPQSGRQCD